MKKSLADDPVNASLLTFSAVAPTFCYRHLLRCARSAVGLGLELERVGREGANRLRDGGREHACSGAQQVTAPALLTAHVWLKLAVTAPKVPLVQANLA